MEGSRSETARIYAPHHLIVAAWMGCFSAGLWMVQLPLGEARVGRSLLHGSLGLLVLALAVVWTHAVLGRGLGHRDASFPGGIARCMHRLLLMGALGVPLSGVAVKFLMGAPIGPIPPAPGDWLPAETRAALLPASVVLHRTAAWLMLAGVVGHAMAAVGHRLRHAWSPPRRTAPAGAPAARPP